MDVQIAQLYGTAMTTTAASAVVVYPLVVRLVARWTQPIAEYQQGKVSRAARLLDDIFMDVKTARLKAAYGLGPVVVGVVAFLLVHSLMIAMVASVFGIVLPDLIVRQVKASRKNKFQIGRAHV